jgi:hypothetical protein
LNFPKKAATPITTDKSINWIDRLQKIIAVMRGVGLEKKVLLQIELYV